MKILITGATGFIGSYILRDLVHSNKYDIVATKRKNSRTELVADVYDQVQWVECGLMDLYNLDDAIKDCHAVIHAAGQVSFSHLKKAEVFETNVTGTANLINLAIDNNIHRFIHFSSVSALGKKSGGYDEQSIWNEPRSKSIYGFSKHLGEIEAWRGFGEGLNLTIINPSFVLGGSFWDYGPLQMLSKIDEGLKYYPTGSNGVVDVRDVSDMTLRILERDDLAGQRFICSAGNISHLDLFNKICDVMNRPGPTVPVHGLLGAVAWRWESIKSRLLKKEAIFTKEAYQIASADLAYDNTKSRDMLGFDYLPLRKTIDDVVSCYYKSREEGHTYGILR